MGAQSGLCPIIHIVIPTNIPAKHCIISAGPALVANVLTRNADISLEQ
jgi:hypothetical protein